jgi:hypothetical protein
MVDVGFMKMPQHDFGYPLVFLIDHIPTMFEAALRHTLMSRFNKSYILGLKHIVAPDSAQFLAFQHARIGGLGDIELDYSSIGPIGIHCVIEKLPGSGLELIDFMPILEQKKAASNNVVSSFSLIWLPDPGSNQEPID